MHAAHNSWISASPTGDLTYLHTVTYYAPVYSTQDAMSLQGSSKNNFHIMRVDLPHVKTAETAASTTEMFPQVSTEWKSADTGPGELPTSSFTIYFQHIPNVHHRKISLPHADRLAITNATPSPPPTHKHLW
jgi:hypothetical protein